MRRKELRAGVSCELQAKKQASVSYSFPPFGDEGFTFPGCCHLLRKQWRPAPKFFLFGSLFPGYCQTKGVLMFLYCCALENDGVSKDIYRQSRETAGDTIMEGHAGLFVYFLPVECSSKNLCTDTDSEHRGSFFP